MTIEMYDAQRHGPLDGTPGYNDFVLSCRGKASGDQCRVHYLDGLPRDDSGNVDIQAISRSYRFPSEQVARSALSYSTNQAATIFQLPGGGYVLRRSIYDDPCTGKITLARQFNLTSNQVRAIAVFSGTDHDSMWCYAPGSGRNYSVSQRRPYQTPWNLQSVDGLRSFRDAINNVLAGNTTDPVQKEALGRLTAKERLQLRVIASKIKTRLKQKDNKLQLDHNGLGTWIFLASLFILPGLPNHIKEWVNVYRTIRDKIRGKDNNNDKGPPDQDPPASGGGGKKVVIVQGDTRIEVEMTAGELKDFLADKVAPATEPVPETEATMVGLLDSQGEVLGYMADDAVNVPVGYESPAYLPGGRTIYLSPAYAHLAHQQFASVGQLFASAGISLYGPGEPGELDSMAPATDGLPAEEEPIVETVWVGGGANPGLETARYMLNLARQNPAAQQCYNTAPGETPAHALVSGGQSLAIGTPGYSSPTGPVPLALPPVVLPMPGLSGALSGACVAKPSPALVVKP